MKELFGNLWDYHSQGCVVCVTVNGFVKKNGAAVMGRGTARQALDRSPGIDRILGTRIQESGWHNVYELIPRLWSFPVKPDTGFADSSNSNVVSHLQKKFFPGDVVPGWALKADLGIIEASLAMLYTIQQRRGIYRFILPRPGCGAGELNWREEVRPLCEVYGEWLSVISLG